ncbi:MAG: DesA/ISL3 alpha bundle tail domain-containing protein [Phycisphaerae bacterium]
MCGTRSPKTRIRLALNKPLARVYYMKEDLRHIWYQTDKRAATVFLDDWIARARSSGIRDVAPVDNSW